MKPTLSLGKLDLENPWGTLGMVELLSCLKNSGQFEVSYHNQRFNACRCERGTTLFCNDKKIYLDLWDYATPTYTEDTFNANFDLIIKLQQMAITEEEFEKQCLINKMFISHTQEERKNFIRKVVPWTFFCSKMMKPFIGKEDQIKTVPIERFGFFCGKDWRCRRVIKAKLLKEGIPYLQSDQETNKLPFTSEDYLHWMKSSKFGIVIHGRGAWLSEGKNRREIDYMMLKKPLLLNYKPNYYNPLVEGKHYIYIDQNTDFKNLETLYNISEMAMNGFQWYKDNASQDGIVKTFLQIMRDRKLI
jgi:hypothetical protein